MGIRNPAHQLALSFIQARLSMHLTQEALAKKAGVSQTVIARIERGTNNPTLATMNRVAAALGKRITLTS